MLLYSHSNNKILALKNKIFGRFRFVILRFPCRKGNRNNNLNTFLPPYVLVSYQLIHFFEIDDVTDHCVAVILTMILNKELMTHEFKSRVMKKI
jgi:hypothetical protein